MKRIHFAAVATLLFALCSVAIAQTSTQTASATWRVQKYDLDVTLPVDSARSVAIRANLGVVNVSGKPAGTLTLRISTLADVSGVKVNGSTADFAKSEEKLGAANLQRIAIRFASIPGGVTVPVSVEYKLNIKENSALSVISPSGSQFLPLSFWYPTPNSWFFAKGADMAPFSIKVSPPGGLKVVSSGVESGGTFEQKLNGQPFFAVGNWDVVDRSGVTAYLPKGSDAEALKRAAEIADIASEARIFGIDLLGKAPDAPLRIVASRRGAGFAGGGTVFVDENVLRRSKIDSLTAMNVAESVVRLWIGNAIAVNGEGHGVISEGLVRYIATQFIERKYGKDVADTERLRQRIAYSAVSKRDAPMGTVSPLDDYYFPEVANKGAMAWRILAKRVGSSEFAAILRSGMQDGTLDLGEIRAAFSSHKELVDYLFDQVTDMNLLVGLPQVTGGETKAALRNTGAVDVTVDVAAITATGERIVSPATIKGTSFGEISFKSPAKIVKIVIDADKLYPQTDYSDDYAPRDSTDSDPVLAAKRLFDKQDFAGAEVTARDLLKEFPRHDDLRTLLARSLLAQNKNAEAEKEFKAVLEEKLSTARSIAWANVGLAEISSRTNLNAAAIKYANTAILADAEYGASLAARSLRNRLNYSSAGDAAVKTFFADFDRAAGSNRKAEVDAMIVPGEVTKFAGGVSGSTEKWQTQVAQIDFVGADVALVEANMTIKLLNKEVETGMAVYRLLRFGGSWKLAGVEMFEVR